MSPHDIAYKQTWYPPDVRQWWETFTNLFLSNKFMKREGNFKLNEMGF